MNLDHEKFIYECEIGCLDNVRDLCENYSTDMFDYGEAFRIACIY